MALSPRDEEAIRDLVESAPLPTVEQRDNLVRLLRLTDRDETDEPNP